MEFDIPDYYKTNIIKFLQLHIEDVTPFDKILTTTLKYGFIGGYYYGKMQPEVTEPKMLLDWKNEASVDIMYIEDMKAQLIADISSTISQTPEVSCIFLCQENDVLNIWTLINTLELTKRENVYEKEIILLDSYPELAFDFRVSMLTDVSVDEIINSGYRVIFSRLENA